MEDIDYIMFAEALGDSYPNDLKVIEFLNALKEFGRSNPTVIKLAKELYQKYKKK
ncbi:hypothetical protein ABGT15_04410 [Flavobacterium enshiense]|uniref:hypothetical protein n=1 Tax=Flavobacterium enshiense TaxID=1341165 RepID=UPI00345C8919